MARWISSRRTVLKQALGASVVSGTTSLAGCAGFLGTGLPSCKGTQKEDVSVPTNGSEDAPVTIAVYSDYACPHCATWELEKADELTDVIEDGTARYVRYSFPIPVSDESFPAANAARSVYHNENPATYWQYNRRLYENQESLTTDRLVQLAEELGASMEKVRTAATDLNFCSAIKKDKRRGKNAGVSGTPTILVGEELFTNPSVDEVKAAVEAQV